MINRNRLTKLKTQPRVAASFGRANLVRTAGCNYELRGATDDDLTAGKEWVSFFMHEAVLCVPTMPHRRATSNSRWKESSLGRSA
jgi:hypothetical protein